MDSQSEGFRKLSLLLYLGIQVAGLGQCEGGDGQAIQVSGILGESVSFTTRWAQKIPANATWKIRKEDRNNCKEKTGENCTANFQERIIQHPENHTIELKTVQSSDEGTYRVRLSTEWKVLYQEYFRLQVYEAILKPNITVTVTNTSRNGSCNVVLTCAVHKGSNVTYTWVQQEAAVSHQPFSHRGQSMKVHLQDNVTLSYTCRVHNPVSAHNVTIQLRNSCAHRKLMDPREDVEVNSTAVRMVYILSAVAAGCLLVLLVLFCRLVFLRHKKKPDQDAELHRQSLTIYATISSTIQHPQIQQAVTHPLYPQGNTIYSEVTGHQSM